MLERYGSNDLAASRVIGIQLAACLFLFVSKRSGPVATFARGEKQVVNLKGFPNTFVTRSKASTSMSHFPASMISPATLEVVARGEYWVSYTVSWIHLRCASACLSYR